MKVPPKRKGNKVSGATRGEDRGLNESPSEKEGKSWQKTAANKTAREASMKVPPKRKGNTESASRKPPQFWSLNESPSEKEGKCRRAKFPLHIHAASMKVPPKRKGNSVARSLRSVAVGASMKVPPKRKGNYGCSPCCRMVGGPQ